MAQKLTSSPGKVPTRPTPPPARPSRTLSRATARGVGERVAGSKLIGVAFVVLLLVCWEVASRRQWIPPVSIPPVTEVAREMWRLWLSGELVTHLVSSLRRMFVGYAIATLAGVGLGIGMGVSRLLHNLFEPLTELLRPIPSPAYIPIVIILLGIGDEMKIFMVALAAFFPILINTYSGVQSVDPVMIDTARTLGVRRRRILQRIVLPATSPYIFAGLRVSLAISLILVVISEMVASNEGIGFFILHAQRGFRVREMYAGVVTLAVVGYTLNRLFLLVESKLLAWHHGYSGYRRKG
jgi:ABC-type nitrate/sulfonate/bicarbonate transport system permease component